MTGSTINRSKQQRRAAESYLQYSDTGSQEKEKTCGTHLEGLAFARNCWRARSTARKIRLLLFSRNTDCRSLRLNMFS